MTTTEKIIEAINNQQKAIEAHHAKTDKAVQEVTGRLDCLETKSVRSPGADDDAPLHKSLGSAVIQHAEFKARAPHMRDKRDKLQISIDTKALTSASGSAGSMVPADHRPDVVRLPERGLTIRDLIAPGQTGSNSVQYSRQTTRTNNADVVSEGIKKPESVYAFELVDAPVRTIAHFVKASRQVWDDAAMLRSTIDSELRYGLKLKEEDQLLNGDGTGQNLYGIVPQAAAYSSPFEYAPDNETRLDVILQAICQAQQALLPVTGVVVNDIDLMQMLATKGTDGKYLIGSPLGAEIRTLWSVPVVGTPSMTQGDFLVGAFRDGAQIFDREEINVLISSENEDDFVKNLVTVLCEERMTLTVKRPSAFVAGEFGTISG